MKHIFKRSPMLSFVCITTENQKKHLSYGRSIKDKMPSTNVGKYNSKQVELFLYGKNIEELKGKRKY